MGVGEGMVFLVGHDASLLAGNRARDGVTVGPCASTRPSTGDEAGPGAGTTKPME